MMPHVLKGCNIMGIHSWLIYISLVFVATATPGPAVLFVMATSTLYGWRKCMFAALGNIVGLLCLGIIAVTGLGAVLKTSLIIFSVIKYAGAAYLMFLGIKMILEKEIPSEGIHRGKAKPHVSSKKIFTQAMGIALSNPKAIIFLTALFPQFIDINKALLPQFSQLIVTLMLFSFFFLMAYALITYRAGMWMKKPGRVKLFKQLSGSVFIGFGVLLARSSNR